MAFKFNPLTGNLDLVGSGGSGGGGVVFGDAASFFTPGMVQYIDQSGDQFGDIGFIRDSGVAKETVVTTNTYAQNAFPDAGPNQGVVQADTVGAPGNAISLTFDGTTIDVDTAVATWNAANPGNTCSVVSGGTTIPSDAGTYNLIGGGTTTLKLGETDVGSLGGDIHGATFVSEDATSGDISLIGVGNLSSLFGTNGFGNISAFSSASGASFTINSIGNAGMSATDFATYQASVRANDTDVSMTFNDAMMGIDNQASNFVIGNSASLILIPFGFTANSGDVLAVTGVAGTDYTLGFVAPGGGGTPGGADTQVQFNDGGAFGGDASFTWNKTNLAFVAGDPTNISRSVLVSVNNLTNEAILQASEGQVLIGDPNNLNNGLSLQIRPQANNAILQGYTNVPSNFASINSTGVTGLNDLSVGGNWFQSTDTSYTVTCVLNNFKAIRIVNPTLSFNPGDTIQNDANITETALIFAVEPISATEFWLICDQSLGPWLTAPAGVTITAGINVGATAVVQFFYDDNDIYSVSSPTVNYSYWPMEQGLSINGAAIGWGAFTGHTVADVWIISFTANYLPAFYANWDNSTINIGVHTLVPQSIAPKGIRIDYNAAGTLPGILEIGEISQSGGMLTFGANSSNGMMYYSKASADRYLDIQPGVSYEFGDLDTSVTGNRYEIIDSTNSHTIYTSKYFDVYYTSAGRVANFDAQTFYAQIGDVDGGGNGTLFELSDSNQRITLNTLKTKITLQSFDDDAAAGAGGLVADELYQTTGAGAAPLNVAGIVMVKQ